MITNPAVRNCPAAGQSPGADVDHQSEKGEDVGINFGESQSVNNQPDYFVARHADRAGVCHSPTNSNRCRSFVGVVDG